MGGNALDGREKSVRKGFAHRFRPTYARANGGAPVKSCGIRCLLLDGRYSNLSIRNVTGRHGNLLVPQDRQSVARISYYAASTTTAYAAFSQRKPHEVAQRHLSRQEIRDTWDENEIFPMLSQSAPALSRRGSIHQGGGNSSASYMAGVAWKVAGKGAHTRYQQRFFVHQVFDLRGRPGPN
jgi:hypothetical protein